MVRLVDLPQDDPSIKRIVDSGMFCTSTHLDPTMMKIRIYVYRKTQRPTKDLIALLGYLE